MFFLFKKLIILFFVSFITTFSLSHAVLYPTKTIEPTEGTLPEGNLEKLYSSLDNHDSVMKPFLQRAGRIAADHVVPPAVIGPPKPQTPPPAQPPKALEKIAYLTFDDGPSKNTPKVLEVLKAYNIKATFFVIGRTGKEYEDLYKEIVNNGHTLGNHTYSHNYSYIYSSVSNIMEDYDKINKYLYNITGVTPEIIRFPGGSNNQVSWQYSGKFFMKNQLIPAVLQKGYVYFDWNVSCGDADGGLPSVETLIDNVKKTLRNAKSAIILFHDSGNATTTPQALPAIIDYLKSQGYEFHSQFSITSNTIQ